jgi:hypothetical protein
MPQHPLHGFEVAVRVQRPGAGGMPQVMEPEIGDPSGL